MINSNAQGINITSKKLFCTFLIFLFIILIEFKMLPGPKVVYNTIGGIFDMYFFLGPSPDDTVKQWTAVCIYLRAKFWFKT
jgi:hypothetical protein